VAGGEGGAGAPSCRRPAARAQEEEAARVWVSRLPQGSRKQLIVSA
jgi:hypothetical protein